MEILQLQSDVVDKIAAGEVVERPAHLLKELLENSIDAGATEVSIEVDEGGKSIFVEDNGKGILPEDLPLVFARHATSKIRESEDLWKLTTFGFRGEALASISSVSRLSLISRRKGCPTAYRICCDFGEVGEVTETSFQEGTQVQVRHLFSNIPARLKFLKSDAAEVTQIKNVVKAMALQNHEVQWKLKVKGKLTYLWPAEDSLLERAKKVLETDRLYENTFEYEGFRSHVVFSDPSTVVRVSRQIWTFVQNRWVQDKGLQAAVMEAYRSLLMHGQYPICLVSVMCPHDEVDVNIHPTKSAVKFVDRNKAFRVVHYALREAIEKAPWRETPVNRTPVSEKVPPSAPPLNESFQEASFTTTQFQQKQKLMAATEKAYQPRELSFGALQELALDRQQQEGKTRFHHNPALFEKPVTEPVKGFWSQLQVVGQIDLTYIVAQSHEKMYLVDQHAAHERVAFERLMRAWKTGGIETQNLLLPITVDLEETEVEAILSAQQDLRSMGVDVEQEGPASLAISSLPSIVKEKGLIEALKKLADDVTHKGGSFALETAIADLFATMACHSVVRAGQALSQEEMKQLLVDMDEFPLSGFCPHGRSVSIDFPFVQLEKDFGRRV